MSKVTMPKPMGYLHVCRKKPSLREFKWVKSDSVLAALGYESKGVITTAHAEAYADARVREALEEAEEAVTKLYESEELPLLPDIAKAINACMTRGK